jgi:hypothetical protein
VGARVEVAGLRLRIFERLVVEAFEAVRGILCSATRHEASSDWQRSPQGGIGHRVSSKRM